MNRIVITSVIKGFLLAIAISAAVFLYLRVQDTRARIAELQNTLDTAPERETHRRTLQRQLESRSFDVQRVEDYILTRDAIVQLIQRIEQEATRENVAVNVSDISEYSTESVSEGKMLQDIRIKAAASGNPVDLLTFLHRVERLPFLLYVPSWKIDAEGRISGPADGPVLPSEEGVERVSTAALRFDVMITMNMEEQNDGG